jgi:uncharacterized protein YeaO (DUF488 family)/3-methyladenine DNA glycosylase AlkC
MFKLNLNRFYSPEDSDTSLESGKMSVSDMTDFLGQDDDNTELPGLDENPETDEEDPEEKGKKEGKAKTIEDEIESELEDEDKLETLNEDEEIFVSRKEILTKYPNLFKEFPHLDKAVYRERKYAEMLPTIEDAKLAVEKSEVLDNFSKELAEGNSVSVLKSVKDEDPQAFNALVDNYLDNLRTVDQGAYFHVLSNVIKHTVLAMHSSADDDDKIAAKLLHKFIFNTDKFTPPSKLAGDTQVKDEKAEALNKKEEEFNRKQLETHANSINTRIGNTITSILDKNLDPRESMTPYVKQKAIRDCSEQLEEAITKDTRFTSLIDRLWEKAADADYNQESLDKIRSAYLSKAKGLLPEIIRKTRNIALKGLGNKSPDNDRRGPLPVGRPSTGKKENTGERRSTGTSDKEKAKALPKGTKSLDYLMRD